LPAAELQASSRRWRTPEVGDMGMEREGWGGEREKRSMTCRARGCWLVWSRRCRG
jgi:hypothetical protein